jgi:hypothetical protein
MRKGILMRYVLFICVILGCFSGKLSAERTSEIAMGSESYRYERALFEDKQEERKHYDD